MAKKTEEEKGLEMVRKYSMKYYGRVMEQYERLGRYCPDAMVKWIELRQALYQEPPKAALTLREKELIAVAIQIVTRKPDVSLHTRKAIEYGASVKEIAEVAGLCILLGGMMTYVESGQYALKAAEEYAKKSKSSKKKRK